MSTFTDHGDHELDLVGKAVRCVQCDATLYHADKLPPANPDLRRKLFAALDQMAEAAVKRQGSSDPG